MKDKAKNQNSESNKMFAEEIPWRIQLDKIYLTIMRFVILFFSALIFSIFSPQSLYSPIFLVAVSAYVFIISAGIYIAYLKSDWKYYEYLQFFFLVADLFFAHIIVFLIGVFQLPLYLLYVIIMLIAIARFPDWKSFSFFGILGGGGFVFLSYFFESATFLSKERIIIFILLWFLALTTSIFIIFSEQSRKYLEKSQFLLERVIGAFPDGLIMYDTYGKIQIINEALKEFLDIKQKDIQSRYITEILNDPSLENLHKIFKAERKKERATEIEILKPIKRVLQIFVLPITGVGQDIIGFINVIHDITREKAIEKIKTEFVSIAAHQLRTPLSAIKWSLKMVLEGDAGPLTKEQSEFLEQSYQSNERIIRLINDLLNVARIEEGKFLYEFSEIQLEDLIENVVSDLRLLAEQKNIKIKIHKLDKKTPKAKIDSSKMRLALQNVIDNAVKYTPPNGKVDIFVKYAAPNLEITVKDTGIGISEEQTVRVFTKFFRTDNAMKMETEGSGLGLFIVKNIIEYHKGKIWFESEINKGTTFHIAIPINAPEKPEKKEEEFEKFITGF